VPYTPSEDKKKNLQGYVVVGFKLQPQTEMGAKEGESALKKQPPTRTPPHCA